MFSRSPVAQVEETGSELMIESNFPSWLFCSPHLYRYCCWGYCLFRPFSYFFAIFCSDWVEFWAFQSLDCFKRTSPFIKGTCIRCVLSAICARDFACLTIDWHLQVRIFIEKPSPFNFTEGNLRGGKGKKAFFQWRTLWDLGLPVFFFPVFLCLCVVLRLTAILSFKALWATFLAWKML